MARLSIYTNPLYYRHDTGFGHPESADRITAALEGVRRAGAETLVVERPEESPETERLIAKVHSPDYARELERACSAGHRFFHSLDNPISSGSFLAAREAVGVALAAAADVWEKDRADRAFVIARPPGHHAERIEAMGFCFFNTIAIVAERLRELPGIDRVFIFDWDVHHGNGTQDAFYDRADVFYSSIHQYPFYPGTGAADETGTGAGAGTTLNFPMNEGSGDADYLRLIEERLLKAIDEFRPNALLISAGFDAHSRDPLGGMRLSTRAFREMTARLNEAAARYTGGRMLSLLEGGYDPEALADSVAQHLDELRDAGTADAP